MNDSSNSNTTEIQDQWFEQHPVVSTVLWLIGGITKSPELPCPPEGGESGKIPRTNSRLSWKDEHDGEIAEYISHDAKMGNDKNGKNEKNGKKEKKEKKHVTIMPRQKSLAEVGEQMTSIDSGDDNIYLRSTSSSTDDEDEESSNRPGPSSRITGDLMDMDDNTMSPQWGWYVSTTPPQELYGKSGSGKPSVPESTQ
jgi:hypothetical protein